MADTSSGLKVVAVDEEVVEKGEDADWVNLLNFGEPIFDSQYVSDHADFFQCWYVIIYIVNFTGKSILWENVY